MRRHNLTRVEEVPTTSTAPAAPLPEGPAGQPAQLQPVTRRDVDRLSMRVALAATQPHYGRPFVVRSPRWAATVRWEQTGHQWAPVIVSVQQADGTPRPDLIEAVQTTMAEYWPPRKVRRRHPNWPR